MASSNSLAVAMKKARLAADFEVAQKMEQELSGIEQQFTGDSNGMAREQYQSAVERFVAAVPMMGQEVAEQEISVIDGKYTAYILSRLSFDQMDRMAERQKRQIEGTSEMKEAFTMLRERVEATTTRSSGSGEAKVNKIKNEATDDKNTTQNNSTAASQLSAGVANFTSAE
jgi:hypothetical protein